MERHLEIQHANLNKNSREWDGVISSSKLFSFFHTSHWLHIIEDAYHLKPYHLIVRDKGEPVMAMPLFLSENGLHSPYLADYGGACVNQKFAINSWQVKAGFERLFTKIGRIGKEEGVPAAYVRGYYATRNLDRYLIEGSFKRITEHLTYVLSEFFDVEDTLSIFHKKTRNAVRKGLKEGLTIEKIPAGSKAMEEYVRLHTMTKRKHGSEPFNDSFFGMLSTIPPENVDIMLVRYNGHYIAGLLAFIYNDRMQIFDNCSDPNYLKFNPNHLLYYTLIEKARVRRMEVDFGKTSLDHHSLRQFKERWGGKMYPFDTYMRILPPVALNTVIMGTRYLKKHGARDTFNRVTRRRQ